MVGINEHHCKSCTVETQHTGFESRHVDRRYMVLCLDSIDAVEQYTYVQGGM